MGRRILVVDDDPWIRRMVASALERHAYQVDNAADGYEGLAKAVQIKPDLIISDVLMPRMDGWAFIRALRSNPETSLVPVIFLTALNKDDDRILGFRLGADDYLAKPFRLEELDLRVERVLRLGALMHQNLKQQRREEGMPGFRGDLAQLGVASVLTVLEIERKSGVVVLRQQDRTGRVFVRDGHVLSASFDGGQGSASSDVVFELLTWKTGSFQFTALEVEMEDKIGTSITHLLLEGARLIDENTGPLDTTGPLPIEISKPGSKNG
jgi:two-component system, OmpR family, response regulator